MAILVWATLGIALWHFAVWVPDNFRGGIVGAFVAAIVGSIASGLIWQLVTGDGIGETDVVTALAAIPGFLVAMLITYQLGVRDQRDQYDEV